MFHWFIRIFMAVVYAVTATVIGTAHVPSPPAEADSQASNSVTIEFDNLPNIKPYNVSPPAPPIFLNGLTRDTGMDMQSCSIYEVCGTDLGIPVELPPDEYGNRRVMYLWGDTFAIAGPFMEHTPGADKYRAQAILTSGMMPTDGQPLIFDGSLGTGQPGTAPDLFGWNRTLTDGISFAETGEIYLSWQSIVGGEAGKPWETRDAGLARSTDGGAHFELVGPLWENNADNTDPYQMWSMTRDGDYVYVVSVRAGRQHGPMMLFRVPWNQLLDKSAYTYWNGSEWGSQDNATPIMNSRFGEPSLRKLQDGTWVLSYVDYSKGPKLVTQTLVDNDSGPSGEWNQPKVQLVWHELPNLYGGFIHPFSTADNLILMVSTWQREKPQNDDDPGRPIRYDVMHMITSVW